MFLFKMEIVVYGNQNLIIISSSRSGFQLDPSSIALLLLFCPTISLIRLDLPLILIKTFDSSSGSSGN